MRLTVLDFAGKKLAQWFITHKTLVGHRPPPLPPMSTLCPPHIIHVIIVPRLSQFFALFCFHVLYWRTKSSGGLGMRLTKYNTSTYPCCCLALNLQENTRWIIQRCGSQCGRIRNLQRKRDKTITLLGVNMLCCKQNVPFWWLANNKKSSYSRLWSVATSTVAVKNYSLLCVRREKVGMLRKNTYMIY